MADKFIFEYLEETKKIASSFDLDSIDRLINLLLDTRNKNGRVFILGVGGSAGNASHMVNDLRKIVELESYAPTDNVSELTARTNDEGWVKVFSPWLKTSRLKSEDMIFILSVGGGNAEKNISSNLVEAIDFAKQVGAKVGGIVGPKGGYTAKMADACVLVPEASPDRITPHTESFQAIVWHLLVSHPKLKYNQTKWESIK